MPLLQHFAAVALLRLRIKFGIKNWPQQKSLHTNRKKYITLTYWYYVLRPAS